MNSDRGCFALVAYVPEPLVTVLRELRSGLPGKVHSKSHVTILPPRPLHGSLREVSAHLAEVIGDSSGFDIELGSVCLFPDTRVLYLNLLDGYGEIDDLHTALTSPHQTNFQEEHEFRPHVTLAGPLCEADVDSATKTAEAAWAKVSVARRFRVEQIDFLWLEPHGAQADWRQLWRQEMAVASTSCRPA